MTTLHEPGHGVFDSGSNRRGAVPPWDPGAYVGDVVWHFVRHWIADDATHEDKLRFFSALYGALRTAPVPTGGWFDHKWLESFECEVKRSVVGHEQAIAERSRTGRSTPTRR